MSNYQKSATAVDADALAQFIALCRESAGTYLLPGWDGHRVAQMLLAHEAEKQAGPVAVQAPAVAHAAPPSPLTEQDKVDAELTPEFLEAVRATADELLRGNAGLGAMRQAALWLQDFYLAARAKKEQP